jgi:VCBS repeat-containing protein
MKTRFSKISLLLAILGITTAPAQGLVNGSFEAGYTGWTAIGHQHVKSGAPYAATDGIKLVAFNDFNQPPDGRLSQVFPTIPGQAYTLAFDAGVLAYNTSSQTMLVAVRGTGSLLSKTITLAGPGNGTNFWQSQSFSFVADGAAATLTFQDQSIVTADLDLLLDRVQVNASASGPNTAPVAVADFFPVARNTTLVVAAAGVLANDTDAEANTLAAAIDTDPSHGNITLNANGGFTYTPAANYTGTDSFTYHAYDGSLNSNVATVAITVNALPPGLKILPLGDSITYGWQNTNAGYRGPLHDLIIQTAPDFRYLGTSVLNPGSLPATPLDQRHHEGHSSYTIQDVANNLDGFDNSRFLAIGGADRNPNGGYWLTGGNGTGRDPMDPDIITLLIGSNDWESPAGVEDRLRSLISKITTLRPATRLLIATIVPRPDHAAFVATYNDSVASVAAEFKAAGNNVHLVDLNTGFPPDGLLEDRVHPNDIGFDWMARRWFDAIIQAYSPPVGPVTGVIREESFATTSGKSYIARFRVLPETGGNTVFPSITTASACGIPHGPPMMSGPRPCRPTFSRRRPAGTLIIKHGAFAPREAPAFHLSMDGSAGAGTKSHTGTSIACMIPKASSQVTVASIPSKWTIFIGPVLFLQKQTMSPSDSSLVITQCTKSARR